MNKVIHRADSRGKTETGWLYSRHTFSFGGYYEPERLGFGRLIVLNDDVVAPGRGFPTHPHENMEIVSIPLSGALRHCDSMGNQHIISSGEVQIMSAGTGITHSEYNNSSTAPVEFLQIWVVPKEQNIEPRYALEAIPSGEPDKVRTIVTPDPEMAGAGAGSVWINQDAYFTLVDIEAGRWCDYSCNLDLPALYVFVVSGEVGADGDVLATRDGMAVENPGSLSLHAQKASKVLLIETSLA